eukprot:Phypoly_transcript_14794.p1 GENE.Phypoly_transcript_14794~~Phypoly_transcript_14794.p1  ORF type:complete len:263 (+),score=66.75 Phypoly_transcript_14794:98-886(+)
MDREELVFCAKLAEEAERYEEMADYMTRVARLQIPLSVEERNLLSVAYKNVIGARRAAWRILCSIDQKEKKKAEESRRESKEEEREREGRWEGVRRGYIGVVEGELKRICEEVVEVAEKCLIPHETSFEGRTFFWKMKADYWRYLAEFMEGEERATAAQNALHAYNEAQAVSLNLRATHPIRLGLGLNFSVFYYEILNNPERSCRMAKETFDAAIAGLDELSEEDYKDSTVIMQLMRDGLTLWTSDMPGDEDENGEYSGDHA